MSLFGKKIDFLAIGDITTDAFIRLKEAHINCKVNTSECEICLKFGDKVPFESVHVVRAVGNSANAAVAAARMGLNSALMTVIGDDQNGKDCVTELKKNGVITKFTDIQKGKVTNFHYVLWYDVDRTILVHHEEFNYKFPASVANSLGNKPKWIYLSSLASNSFPYHVEITEYLKKNPDVKLAFQPGTFQMKLGAKQLHELYERSDVFVVNVEESQRILGIPETGFVSIDDTKKLLREIHALGPKLVLITDGPKGAYMFDGDHSYYMPIYPDPKPPFERTGCGDSFASTFVVALIKGHTPLEALLWAPINPMSVVQYIGAQEGLLGQGQLDTLLANAPKDYLPKEI